MHTTLKSVNSLSNDHSRSAVTLLGTEIWAFWKGSGKNSCFEKNMFESNVLYMPHELKLPPKNGITNVADLHTGFCVM